MFGSSHYDRIEAEINLQGSRNVATHNDRPKNLQGNNRIERENNLQEIRNFATHDDRSENLHGMLSKAMN